MDIFQIWQEVLGWNDHEYMQTYFGQGGRDSGQAAPSSPGLGALLDYANSQPSNNEIAIANTGHDPVPHGDMPVSGDTDEGRVIRNAHSASQGGRAFRAGFRPRGNSATLFTRNVINDFGSSGSSF